MRRPSSDLEPLSESLGSAGGLKQFRTVAGGRTHVRDDPFGVTPATPKTEQPVSKAKPPEKSIAPSAKVVRQDRQRAADSTPVVKTPPADAATLSTEGNIAVERPPEAAEEPPSADPAAGIPKASIFTENVTVPLSVALRDRAEELARHLNRSRTVRKERITRNTIIRVALEQFLDTFSPNSEPEVNTETELLQLVRSELGRDARSRRQ